MKQISSAGIGVVVVSWYPPNTQDPVQRGHELTVEDHKLMPALLESAAQAGLEIALHVEPYEGRNADNLRRHLEYVHSTYGTSPALQRRSRSKSSTQEVPVFYLYDQYRQPASEWAKILDPQSTNTVRNTALDGFFICLVVEYQHLQYAVDAHCDGIYTYFASPISWGATMAHWKQASAFAKSRNLLFAPSVGPGYVDTRVRPWNAAATRSRAAGEYYQNEWRAAIHSQAEWIGVTSFNEWHEGTQIEPANSSPPSDGNFKYEIYEGGPTQYLELTLKWAKTFDPAAFS